MSSVTNITDSCLDEYLIIIGGRRRRLDVHVLQQKEMTRDRRMICEHEEELSLENSEFRKQEIPRQVRTTVSLVI